MAKILLVEDNAMNRDMLSRRLQRRGHEVVVAADGAEGLELSTWTKVRHGFRGLPSPGRPPFRIESNLCLSA